MNGIPVDIIIANSKTWVTGAYCNEYARPSWLTNWRAWRCIQIDWELNVTKNRFFFIKRMSKSFHSRIFSSYSRCSEKNHSNFTIRFQSFSLTSLINIRTDTIKKGTLWCWTKEYKFKVGHNNNVWLEFGSAAVLCNNIKIFGVEIRRIRWKICLVTSFWITFYYCYFGKMGSRRLFIIYDAYS